MKANAEMLKAAEPIGYRINLYDSSEGWCLGIIVAGTSDLTTIENEYTQRRYTSAEDAVIGARHAIKRFNTPKLGLRKAGAR